MDPGGLPVISFAESLSKSLMGYGSFTQRTSKTAAFGRNEAFTRHLKLLDVLTLSPIKTTFDDLPL